MNNADRHIGVHRRVPLDHKRPADLVLVHQVQRLLGQHIGFERFGIGRHHFLGGRGAQFLEVATNVTVGDRPDQAPGTIDNAGNAESHRCHRDDDVPHRRRLFDQRKAAAAVQKTSTPAA